MSRTVKTAVRQETKPCKIVLQIELKMILSEFVLDVESTVTPRVDWIVMNF